jgi:hypothetical protein
MRTPLQLRESTHGASDKTQRDAMGPALSVPLMASTAGPGFIRRRAHQVDGHREKRVIEQSTLLNFHIANGGSDYGHAALRRAGLIAVRHCFPADPLPRYPSHASRPSWSRHLPQDRAEQLSSRRVLGRPERVVAGRRQHSRGSRASCHRSSPFHVKRGGRACQPVARPTGI